MQRAFDRIQRNERAIAKQLAVEPRILSEWDTASTRIARISRNGKWMATSNVRTRSIPIVL